MSYLITQYYIGFEHAWNLVFRQTFFRKIKNSTRKNRISENIFLLKKSTRIPRLLSKSERKRATELGESSNLALKFFVDTHGTSDVHVVVGSKVLRSS